MSNRKREPSLARTILITTVRFVLSAKATLATTASLLKIRRAKQAKGAVKPASGRQAKDLLETDVEFLEEDKEFKLSKSAYIDDLAKATIDSTLNRIKADRKRERTIKKKLRVKNVQSNNIRTAKG